MRILILTLLALILTAVFIRLGFWQLHRYDEKKEIVVSEQLRNQSPALTQLPTNLSDINQLKYHPVQLQGKFLRINFLLDNRHHQHQIGYEILTPFEIYPASNIIIVNRGWIARDQIHSLNKASLPQTTEINGVLYLPSTKQFTLKTDDIDPEQNNQIIQSINLKQLSESINHPIYPLIVLLDKNAPHGFVRDWKLVNSRPEKSLGYALQWFSFALVLLLIYFILLIRFLLKKRKTIHEN